MGAGGRVTGGSCFGGSGKEGKDGFDVWATGCAGLAGFFLNTSLSSSDSSNNGFFFAVAAGAGLLTPITGRAGLAAGVGVGVVLAPPSGFAGFSSSYSESNKVFFFF